MAVYSPAAPEDLRSSLSRNVLSLSSLHDVAMSELGSSTFKSGFGLDFPPPGSRYPGLSDTQKTVVRAIDEVIAGDRLLDLVRDAGDVFPLSETVQETFDQRFSNAAVNLRFSLCSLLGCEDREAKSGAPFRAPLWRALALLVGDEQSDESIYDMLDLPYPVGINETIPLAGNLPPFSLSEAKLAKEPGDFRSAFRNYESAESMPTVVREYISEELQAGRMELVPDDELQSVVVTRVAAIAKSSHTSTTPSWRLVEDYRRSGVNRKITPASCPESLSLPSLRDLRRILVTIGRNEATTDYLGFQMDFRKAYRHVRFSQSERSFLCVRCPALDPGKSSSVVVRHTALPFGLRSAGLLWVRTASSLGRIIFRLLDNGEQQLLGCLYIDDFTLWIPKAIYDQTVCRILLLTKTLGLWLSWNKLVLHAEKWKVLGFWVSLPSLQLGIPSDKLTSTVADLQRLLEQPVVRLSEMRRLIGRLTWFSQVLVLVKPFLQRLHGVAGYMERTRSTARVGRELRYDVKIWLAALENASAPVYVFPKASPVLRRVLVASDACIRGIGGLVSVCEGEVHTTWYFRLSLDHIPGPLRRLLLRGRSPSARDMTVLELLASGLGLVLATQLSPPSSPLVLFTDSSAAAHCLRKCYSAKKRMSLVMRAIAIHLSREGRVFESLEVLKLSSEANLAADFLSRSENGDVPADWRQVDALTLVEAFPWKEFVGRS
ncbi:hypothetical protein FOZ61_010227 [Perkinsus olseni]|uniref:Reverse transcriptase domain-containing protein n=1 Tax=Perkinsus olseni TaxID=32597 RepID=A0A7J6KX11_PEROL|nr:hypothetical protein FOZ61_010227 [Perkinsus olseni]KAF4651885.1 hypothetical protein FOL46_010007 [Perkinsus olseni]